MKKEKIATGLAAMMLVSAITATVCSSAVTNLPEVKRYEITDSVSNEEHFAEYGESSFGDTYGDDNSEISDEYKNVSDISEPISDSSEPPEPLTPVFDDPESYLEYDPETDSYILPEEEESFASQSLFVGDSICLGFWAWGVVEGKNVYATGNVGARNLFDYQMYYRSDPAQFLPVLNEVKPKHIIFSMGMNDVNLTTAEEYCENYKLIVDTALANSDSDVYICAITPISDLKFTSLENIDEFNSAIEEYISKNYKEKVHFIDFTAPLKAEDGTLIEEYNGGDGIHLSKVAYNVALHEIYQQAKSITEN